MWTTPNRARASAASAAVLLLAACQPETTPGDPAADTPAPAPAALADASRELATRLGSELKSELQRALADGGPPAAVGVCRERAPAIAARLSQESGARVGRTSLRVRNPANAPADWQRDVLARFDRAAPLTAGEAPPEYHEAPPAGPDGYRYMRAIPAAGLCLTCHGRALAPEVEAALAQYYPDDRATGYDAGEVRGAFVVTWPRSP